MILNKTGKKIAFITSSLSRSSSVSPFMEYLVEGMLPSTYGSLQPVWVVVRQDLLKDDTDSIHFLIRRGFKSDYMEAADFINAGNADAVIVHSESGIINEENSGYLAESLRRMDIPVILSLLNVPGQLDDSAHQHLMDSCDAAVNVITINKYDYELLSTRYCIDHRKLEYMTVNLQDDPEETQINWFHLGRQYWRVVDKQLSRTEGELRSLQANREHSVLYSQ